MFPLHTRISPLLYFFFFFNDTATTEIYTLSLHDVFRSQPGWRGADCALACRCAPGPGPWLVGRAGRQPGAPAHAAARHRGPGDRKSTRLNSSHLVISYAVFCLKKKQYTAGSSNDVTHLR